MRQTKITKIFFGEVDHVLFMTDSFALRTSLRSDWQHEFRTAAFWNFKATLAVDACMVSTHQHIFETPRTVLQVASSSTTPFAFEFIYHCMAIRYLSSQFSTGDRDVVLANNLCTSPNACPLVSKLTDRFNVLRIFGFLLTKSINCWITIIVPEIYCAYSSRVFRKPCLGVILPNWSTNMLD